MKEQLAYVLRKTADRLAPIKPAEKEPELKPNESRSVIVYQRKG